MLDLSGVESLQEDLKIKAETGEKLLLSGWSINEVRKELWKKPDVEGGNVIPAIEKLKPQIQAAPLALAAKPEQTKDQRPNAQADTDLNPDVVPTSASYEDRMVQLVGIAVHDGLPLDQAIRWAMERMALEGYQKPSGEAPATATTDNVVPSPEPQVTASAPEAPAPETAPPAPEAAVAAESSTSEIIPGFTREMLWAHCRKMTESDEVNALIEKRAEISVEFFKDLEKLYLDAVTRNLKSHGIFYRIKADEDLVSESDLAKAQAKQVKAAMPVYQEGSTYGYGSHLLNFEIGYPNEKANAILAKQAADKVTKVSDTTKRELRQIITESRENQEPVAETAKHIRAYFSELTGDPQNVRSVTIGRTETLSAVSEGQALKKEEVKRQFPKAKLMKAWISPKDPPRAREDHIGLDQEGPIPEDKAFSNGLQYPRDPDGEAEDVINCRCSWIVYAVEDRAEVAEILDQPSEFQGAE
jgi:hypothetical protein